MYQFSDRNIGRYSSAIINYHGWKVLRCSTSVPIIIEMLTVCIIVHNWIIQVGLDFFCQLTYNPVRFQTFFRILWTRLWCTLPIRREMLEFGICTLWNNFIQIQFNNNKLIMSTSKHFFFKLNRNLQFEQEICSTCANTKQVNPYCHLLLDSVWEIHGNIIELVNTSSEGTIQCK